MDDSTVDTLREVLQDMTMNIELLSSGQRSGEALIGFIEEMLKTVEAWAAKYDVLVPALNYNAEPCPYSDLTYNSNLQLVSNPQLHATAFQVMDKHDLSRDLDQAAKKSATVPHQGKAEEARDDRSVLSNVEIEGASIKEHNRGKLLSDSEKLLSDSEIHPEQPPPADAGQDAQTENSLSLIGTCASSGRANPSRIGMRRTRSQGPGSFVANPNDSQNDSAFKHINATIMTDDGDRKAASKQEMGEVIESPDWLPKGWLTEVKTRTTGGSAGAKDKYFVDPNSQRRFRSKREVLAVLNTTTKRKRGRPRKTESTAKLLQETPEQCGEHARDTTQESAQSKSELALVGTSALVSNQIPLANAVTSPPVITSAVTALASSSGPSSLPHPPGQPSEWLVYESLASLPFPIFEHLRHVENNASKGTSACNTTPALWPWMPGHPERLKKPCASSKADENQPSEKGSEETAASTFSAVDVPAAEAVPKRPKKAARKNAS